MKAVLLRFLETHGNRAPARRREDRRERAFRDADEASLDDPAQPPSMAAQQRAPISLLNQDGQRVGLLRARGGRAAGGAQEGGAGRGRRAANGGGRGRWATRRGRRGGRRAARRGRWAARRGQRWAVRWASNVTRPTRRGPKWRQGAAPHPPALCKHDSNGHGQKAPVSPIFRLERALRLRAAANGRAKLLVEGEGGFSIPKWE